MIGNTVSTTVLEHINTIAVNTIDNLWSAK